MNQKDMVNYSIKSTDEKVLYIADLKLKDRIMKIELLNVCIAQSKLYHLREVDNSMLSEFKCNETPNGLSFLISFFNYLLCNLANSDGRPQSKLAKIFCLTTFNK